MRKFLMAGTAALALGGTGMAIAAESSNVLRTGSGLVTSDSIRKDLEGMGYRVVRVGTEDGTYKVRATDTETGMPLKLTYDVATGELLKAKPDH
jgi:hypothetical protein